MRFFSGYFRLFCALIVCLIPSLTACKTQAQERILTNIDLITINVSVIDRHGQMVSGLPKDSFTVLDDKMPQQISYFSDADLPASVGIIFDTSSSMSAKKIDYAREALSRFIETSNPQDDFFLIGFGSRPQLEMDWTHDAEDLNHVLTNVRPQGETALFDAVYIGLQKIEQGSHSRRILLLISDGEENNSRLSESAVRRSLKESTATLYAVSVGATLVIKLAMQAATIMKSLSAATGGAASFVDHDADMASVFEDIAVKIRHQYSIGYRPTSFSADGAWHNVRIVVMQPDNSTKFIVRSRTGYFASPIVR